MGRLWLIARREVIAYTGVASFWAALVIGPLLIAVATLAASAQAPKPPQVVEISSSQADLGAAAAAALRASGVLVRIPGSKATASTRVLIEPNGGGASVRILGAPLPPGAARTLTVGLETALRERFLRAKGVSPTLLDQARALTVSLQRPPGRAAPQVDPRQIGRYAMAMLLWLNLIGALGMLLQAIVRERSHRALESLLSAARPVEIVAGKLLGVGLVSLIVLFGWLGAGALGAATISPSNDLLAGVLTAAFGAPLTLLSALAVYVLAFVMYGAWLLGLGALARDVAAAQNLSRPVFGVLLLVFFTALSGFPAGAGMAGWLLWAPPVTPFAILLARATALDPAQIAGAVAVMALTTVVGLWFATRALARQADGLTWRSLIGLGA